MTTTVPFLSNGSSNGHTDLNTNHAGSSCLNPQSNEDFFADIDDFLNFTTSGRSSFKETPGISPIFKWNKINIAKLRSRLGLSRSRFGKKVGVTRGTVLRWESGDVSPNLSNNKALDSIYLSTRKELLKNPLDT